MGRKSQSSRKRIKEGEKDKNKYLAHPSSSGKKQQRKEDLLPKRRRFMEERKRKNPSMLNNPKGGQGKKYQKARERAAAKS